MNGPYEYRTISPEEILKARAEKLAAADAPPDDIDRLAVLAFRLATETYGVELRHISGVHALKEISHIPGTPEFVLGIINMRGEILSVVDLKKIFNITDDTSDTSRMIVILRDADMEFCLVADEIIGVCHVPPDKLTASLPTLTGNRSDYLLGVSGDGMVIIDGKKLLSAPEMRIDIGS